MNKQLLLALAALGLSFQVYASDLIDVFHAAQSQDAEFAAAVASHEAAQEKLPQGRSLLLPSVSLNANTTRHQDNVQYLNAPPTLPFPQGTFKYSSHGYGATLVQPLFRPQNWEAYSESELQVVQADAQFKIAENDLILRVARAYFDVLMAQDDVDLAEAQKAAISEQLEQAKRNFEVGTATITDTHEAQSRYDLTNAQEIASQSNLEIKKRALQQLTNTMPDNLLRLGDQFKLEPPQPADMEKWVEQAQENNLQLKVAEAGAEIADKEVSRNRGGHYPTVDLVASYSKINADGGTFGVGSDTRSTAIGVQLNLPIFEGGMVQSKLREAEANRDRARDELENTHRTVALRTRQAYLGVVNGIAQVQALQQALKSSESLLASSKLGQEVGVRTNLDVLNAQQQLYSTRRDLYHAEYNYLLSQLQLKAAVGTLAEADVASINHDLGNRSPDAAPDAAKP
jgi:outer membrane protein